MDAIACAESGVLDRWIGQQYFGSLTDWPTLNLRNEKAKGLKAFFTLLISAQRLRVDARWKGSGGNLNWTRSHAYSQEPRSERSVCLPKTQRVQGVDMFYIMIFAIDYLTWRCNSKLLGTGNSQFVYWSQPWISSGHDAQRSFAGIFVVGQRVVGHPRQICPILEWHSI